MRIAIIHENWGAGAARCAHDLRRELGTRHDVTYFPRDGVETAEQVLDELRRFQPHVINCHSYHTYVPYDFLAVVSQIYPTCFTVHDPRPIGTLDSVCWSCDHNGTCLNCPLIAKTWRRYLRNGYYRERASKRRTHNRCAEDLQIVAPSQWLANRLAAQELGRFNIHTIPYGIDLDHFTFRPDCKTAFGFPSDRPVVLFSAWYETKRALNMRKGLPDLAAAFETIVVPKIPNAILAVAGESFAPNHPNVLPLGMVSQERLPELLSAADLYVTPTLADNLPYTVLEAMACGRPIVATNVGGIPEQLVEGDTGFLVPPSDPAALGAAIVKVLQDPTRAHTMGRNARNRAEALYAMDPFVESYEKLFATMAARRKAAA